MPVSLIYPDTVKDKLKSALFKYANRSGIVCTAYSAYMIDPDTLHYTRQKSRHSFRSVTTSGIPFSDVVSDFIAVLARNELNMTDLSTVIKQNCINERPASAAVTSDQIFKSFTCIVDRLKHFIRQKPPIIRIE